MKSHAKRRRLSGRITLRVDPHLHIELVEIAHGLGLDLTGFLTMMIEENLATYIARVNRQKSEQELAKRGPDAIALLHQAIASLSATDRTLLAELARAQLSDLDVHERIAETVAAMKADEASSEQVKSARGR